MNIDAAMGRLEEGFSNPNVTITRVMIPEDQYDNYKLGRRRQKGDFHKAWMLSVGELGQQPVMYFYSYKLREAITKALEWKDSVSPPQQPPQPGQAA